MNIRYLKLKRDIFPIKNFSTKLSLFIKLTHPQPPPCRRGLSGCGLRPHPSGAALPNPCFPLRKLFVSHGLRPKPCFRSGRMLFWEAESFRQTFASPNPLPVGEGYSGCGLRPLPARAALPTLAFFSESFWGKGFALHLLGLPPKTC